MNEHLFAASSNAGPSNPGRVNTVKSELLDWVKQDASGHNLLEG